MLRRRQINSDPTAPRLRSKVAAAGEPVRAATEPVRAAAWKVEERFLWRVADWVRARAQILRWPLERVRWVIERVAWFFEHRILWPIEERTAVSGRAIGASALGALAVGLLVLGVVALSGGESPQRQVVSAEPVTASAPAPAPVSDEPADPVLRGAPPSFEVGDGVGLTGTAPDAKSESVGAGTSLSSTISSGEGGASTSSEKPVPAGPAAMRVAQRFAEAFVLYEIGERREQTDAVFAETTSERLATALDERPPRQPAGVDVPQARVLNLVPGPRNGRAYTVSASLLRLGTTSELRLEVEKRDGAWVVTDVRG